MLLVSRASMPIGLRVAPAFLLMLHISSGNQHGAFLRIAANLRQTVAVLTLKV